MPLKPWYKVMTPREDLRSGKPLDASEFAVHLDQVVDHRAPEDYVNPERFFNRTYLTKGLVEVASDVLRRLSKEAVSSSPVINFTTQFGGGKTHALTLLYHLAVGGAEAKNWKGVDRILEKAQLKTVPQARVAVFIGNEFDHLRGCGKKGEPIRKTPWGEFAWQLAGAEGLKLVEEHEKKMIAPGGSVIRELLKSDKPTLILMDEVLNFLNKARAQKVGESTLASQYLQFIDSLIREAAGSQGVCVVLSLPMSEQEMSEQDEADYGRLSKLAGRQDKPYVLSEGMEMAEIIRRRLFEWGGDVPADGKATIREYIEWLRSRQDQIAWNEMDHAKEAFEATYPFHPTVISVFERKWQTLPRFQRTRGVLKLLALWVSKAYEDGFKGGHKDPLITIGTAPLEDQHFRAAVFEQMGESKLEAAVSADIVGKKSHAAKLDAESAENIRKFRLHQKVGTTVLFESTGGQFRQECTLPEIRLAVGEPDLDLGSIETALDSLTNACYYLIVEKTKYHFDIAPNLNKLLADKKATFDLRKDVDPRIKKEIQNIFSAGSGVERVFFPEKSNGIPDRAVLTIIVLPPDESTEEAVQQKTLAKIEQFIKESGTSARTFKSALVWIIADNTTLLRDEARKLLAWETLEEEADEHRFEEAQKKRLSENVRRAERDIRDAVWRTYRNIFLLDKDNSLKKFDLGVLHATQADSFMEVIINRLRQEDYITDKVSPNFLVRNWPPAFKEWSTKSVRDAFFASPQFPRLINPEVITQTIAAGVTAKQFGYVGKNAEGLYQPSFFGESLGITNIEITEEMYIVPKAVAESIASGVVLGPKDLPKVGPDGTVTTPVTPQAEPPKGAKSGESPKVEKVTSLKWQGEIPHQKWMTFYTKILSKFASPGGLKVNLEVEAKPEGGISKQKVEETKTSLRELGLSDNIKTE